jgi:hydrogenase maturation protease
MEQSVLIIGIGNFDRGDDGVAWHILCGVAAGLGRTCPASPYSESFAQEGAYPHFLFELQLLPEMVDILAQYDAVCFVDAHTGAIPEELQFIPLQSLYEHSPLTHHMNPQSLLSLAQTVNGHVPDAMLMSVRGYAFGFEQSLSPRTAVLAQEAVAGILAWLDGIP